MKGGSPAGKSTTFTWAASAHAVPAAPGSNAASFDGNAINGAPLSTRPSTFHQATRPGVLRNLFVRNDLVMGAGIGVNYTVYINEVATGITCNIAGAAQLNASDITNSAPVAQGDRIHIHMDRSAGVPPAIVSAMELELASA